MKPTEDITTPAMERPGAERPTIGLALVDRRADLAALREEWNALVDRSGASVYQTYEWCAAWWEHLGAVPNRSLHVLVLRDGAELVGVAPFYRQSATILGAVVHRHLSLLGSGKAFHVSAGVFLDDGPSDYLDIIASPEHAEEVAARLARYVRDAGGTIDALELLNIPPAGFCRTALVPALESAGIPCRQSEADLCPRLVLASTVREFLQTLDASARRRFQQAITAAEQKTLFSLTTCATETEALDALGELVRIHQRRWRKLGYPGLFGDARFSAFQSAVARAFFRNGWLRVTRADAEGGCAAVRLSFAHNGRLYDYLSGFDDASPAAKRRPGLAILFSQMDEALRDRITVVDFLRGDEGYKFELTSDAPRNVNISARRPEAPGALRSLLWTVARNRAFAGFLLAREWRLLRVQLQEHAFPVSLFRYARFRAGRFVNKFFSAGSRDAGQSAAPDEKGTS